VFNDPVKTTEIDEVLTALTFDTPAKVRAWARYNQGFSGKVFELRRFPGPEACD